MSNNNSQFPRDLFIFGSNIVDAFQSALEEDLGVLFTQPDKNERTRGRDRTAEDTTSRGCAGADQKPASHRVNAVNHIVKGWEREQKESRARFVRQLHAFIARLESERETSTEIIDREFQRIEDIDTAVEALKERLVEMGELPADEDADSDADDSADTDADTDGTDVDTEADGGDTEDGKTAAKG